MPVLVVLRKIQRKAIPRIVQPQSEGCVHRGLGQRLNKQENHSFRESGMNGFSHLCIQMHCLLLVSGILDTRGYPDFCVIPTFQKRPTVPTVLGRKVGITFCFFSGKEPAFMQKSV